eukprot:13510985-Alexandrium_andersonii.AAC.1
MSASLVGSEMCIRDRSASSCPSSARKSALSRIDLRECSLLLRAAIPVSYTHLTLPTICSV